MDILFFEKPGCINNTKQKDLLVKHGHKITAKSLLTENWTKDTLRPYFEEQPVAKWFNVSAPRIKSGEVNPEAFNEDSAIEAMLNDPLLIRRPLLHIGENKICGFDHKLVDELLNKTDVSDLLVCPNTTNKCD